MVHQYNTIQPAEHLLNTISLLFSATRVDEGRCGRIPDKRFDGDEVF